MKLLPPFRPVRDYIEHGNSLGDRHGANRNHYTSIGKVLT